MNQVFVDSSAFLALYARNDEHFHAATGAFVAADAAATALVTSNFVVAETYALILARLRSGRAVAIDFLDDIDGGLAHVERCTVDDERTASGVLRQHTDKSYSFVDALSFAVMERLGIGQAISYDRHFRKYGKFVLL